MTTHEVNVKRLESIADGLGFLAKDAIFIGGACTQFYVEDPGLHDFRPTNDIDFLVNVDTYKEFAVYSDELRKLGFINDTSEGAPIVRWIYRGIVVDIIPDKSSMVISDLTKPPLKERLLYLRELSNLLTRIKPDNGAIEAETFFLSPSTRLS